MNQTSNRYAAYCRFKGLDLEGRTGNLVDYAQWIAARVDEYQKEKGLNAQEFYREESKTRKNQFTNFELWLNEWVENNS